MDKIKEAVEESILDGEIDKYILTAAYAFMIKNKDEILT